MTQRVATYVRVSTSSQDVAMQRHAIAEWLAKYPGATVTEYCDEAMSGKRDNRPGFQALCRAVEAGEVDAVLVYRLDRLSRNSLGFLKLLIDWIQRDTEFISVTQPVLQLSRDNPFRLTFLAMMVEVAALERETIVTRVRSGLAAAKSRGVKLGRAPGLSPQQVARARELRSAGMSIRRVAGELGVSSSVVHRSLRT